MSNPEYTDRSAEEMADLENQFGAGKIPRGYAYVAPPAPGHDTKGIWHHFGAATRSGYATQAIALHQMLLDALRVPTSLVPHRHASIDIDDFPSDRKDMLIRWMADAVGLPEVLVVTLPPETTMFGMARSLVSYTAGPECTHVSPYAVNLVNSEELDALWCVSDFTARAYTTAGVDTKKVWVVRPPICDGVWRDAFVPVDQIPIRRNPDAPFIFGVLGTWHERKGFYDLVRAYFSEFKRSENIELHIRTSSMDSADTIRKFEERVIADIAQIAKEFGDDNYPASKRQPKIKLLTGTSLTDHEVIKWLGSLSCYVNPSYAEGLGIPHMWAMAQGVPIVTSDFGAVGEFCSEIQGAGTCVFRAARTPVPASMRAHSPIWGDGSLWGTYDPKDLAQSMRHMVDVRMDDGPWIARTVRHHFGYDRCYTGLEKALAHVGRPEILKSWGL